MNYIMLMVYVTLDHEAREMKGLKPLENGDKLREIIK